MTLCQSLSGRKQTYRNIIHFPCCLIVNYRNAEIASGILCGCLPVLPQFFRHFVPKLVSKISTFRLGRSPLEKYKGASSTGRPAPWEEPYDPRLLQGPYLELGQLNRTLGPTTVIHGGKQDSMSDIQTNGQQARDESSQCSATEKEATNGQILGTVRVERSGF